MRACLLLIVATFLAFQSLAEHIPEKGRLLRVRETPVQESDDDKCRRLNASCETCINGTEGISCYLCGSQCRKLDFSGLTSGSCEVNDVKVGQCQLSGLAIIVLICGGVLVCVGVVCGISCFSCYLYCRFCRGAGKRRVTRTQHRMENEMNEIGDRHSQRRAERQARGDEMRRKYGLLSDDDKGAYERL